MNVRIEDAAITGPSTAYYELWVTLQPEVNATSRGGTRYASYDDPNPGRLKVESLVPVAQQPFPTANTGDTLGGVTEARWTTTSSAAICWPPASWAPCPPAAPSRRRPAPRTARNSRSPRTTWRTSTRPTTRRSSTGWRRAW